MLRMISVLIAFLLITNFLVTRSWNFRRPSITRSSTSFQIFFSYFEELNSAFRAEKRVLVGLSQVRCDFF
jgi:hypothetical protein